MEVTRFMGWLLVDWLLVKLGINIISKKLAAYRPIN